MTYSIYIEFTDSTYKVIKRLCKDQTEAKRKAIDYAISHDKEIYFIECDTI